MRGLLKFLLLTLLLIGIGFWIMTIAKSCNDPSKTTLSTLNDNADESTSDENDGVKDLTEDDSESDEFDEAEFDEAEFDDVEFDEDEDEGDDGTEYENDEDEITDEDEDDHDVEEADDPVVTSSSSGTADGKYLVVSGSFLGEINAEREVKRLKSMGYDEAEVVVFDFSQYHTVCVKRTNSLSEARGIKNQLGTKHNIEAYVHRKRSKRG